MARPQPQPSKTKTHKASDALQMERLHKGYAQSMEITKVLADEKSKYQHIRIFDTVANGRVMTLDDIVQITSRDESAYADMLTHLPHAGARQGRAGDDRGRRRPVDRG
ncbi:MAG: hypothetical protein U1E93_04595 [Alphaproteobacteria bacterium]